MQSTRLKQIVSFVVVIGALFTLVPRIFASEQQAGPQREIFVEGARLWPVYCAQCHNARPGSQFSPAQWDAITMHMRTQSIMPAKDMRAIKEFLKQAR
jgi:mono/diheme cytochrome c family protein